jgi:hypothetical protein
MPGAAMKARLLTLALFGTLIGTGCASSDDTLTATDPVLLTALENASEAWQAAGVQAAPPVEGEGEPNVQAVDDARFEELCDTTKKSTLACTLAPTDGKVRLWIRESLLRNPAELQVIVTHEMGHVIQAHLTGSTPTHLPPTAGCVDGAPKSPHAMCAWAGVEITEADVALVEGE